MIILWFSCKVQLSRLAVDANISLRGPDTYGTGSMLGARRQGFCLGISELAVYFKV